MSGENTSKVKKAWQATVKESGSNQQAIATGKQVIESKKSSNIVGQSFVNIQLGDASFDEPPVKDQSFKLEDYVIIRVLGSGAYATVKLATHKPTKKKVAMKIYPKFKLNDANKRKSVMREINCMKKLEHPNVVKLIDYFETPKDLYLI